MANELNYELEANEASSGGDWLKLGVGMHKVTFLQEIPGTTKKMIGTDEVEQSEVLVEYEKVRKKWSLNKGKSTKSLWGQLMVLGKHHKKLTGQTFDILVMESKDKNGEVKKDYKVIQCAELLQQQAKLQPTQ